MADRSASTDDLDPAALDPAALGLPDAAIEVQGLSKAYRTGRRGETKVALRDVDLTIPRGSLFGLLGPNGAGKSTLINILAGLVVKSAGRAAIWGYDCEGEPRQARAAIGVVPQELNIDPFFTPTELLELQAGLYGVPARERRTAEILAVMGLADKAKAYSRTLSGGMKRRLMVAKALVHRPPVLVLDEPTAGVDIELRQQLWAYVRELNANGTTVLLTTHYLEEAEELCDRIAIIDHGRVIASEPKTDLIKRLDSKVLTLDLTAPMDDLPVSLAALGGSRAEGGQLVFTYRTSQHRVQDILDAVAAAGLAIADLRSDEPDLEDIFLQLTARGPGDHAAG